MRIRFKIITNLDAIGKKIVKEVGDKIFDLSPQTLEKVRQNGIKFVISHIHNTMGETGKWRPHSAITLMTRKVKVGIGAHGGYPWGASKVLPATPTAFLRNETIEQMKTNTRLKVDKSRNGAFFNFSFWSNILSQDVSYRRSGIAISETKLMHEGKEIGINAKITPKTGRALVIPILPEDKEQIKQDAFSEYIKKHPNTKKKGLTDKQAGIRDEGGTMFIFRSRMRGKPKYIGGERHFIYFTDDEMRQLANSIWGK
jgi:hypothetical protein